MLYTDDDMVIRQYRRCVALNGISSAVDKPDLLNRAVIFEAEPLDDGKRKTEAEIQAKMAADAPVVVRGILDTLVRALRVYDSVKPRFNNRMADYTRWGCAICEALGLGPRFFERAYQLNIALQNEEAIKGSAVAEWLIRWFDYNKFEFGYIGSASDLLNELEEFAKTNYNKDLQWVEGWPRGPTGFGKKLKEIIPSLREVGFKIEYIKSGGRKYRITKVISDSESTLAGQRAMTAFAEVPQLTVEKLLEHVEVVEPLGA